MKMTIPLARSMYEIDKRTIASLIAMLSNLEEGEELSTGLGKIHKLKDNKFEVLVTDINIRNVVEELSHEAGQESIF